MIERASWIAGLAIAALLWIKAHDAQVRNGALAEARADSMRTVLATGDSLRGALQVNALALDSLKRTQAQHYQRDRAVLAVADRRMDSTRTVLDSLLRSLPDTAPVAIAITNERIAGASCKLALGAADSLITLCGAELANRDSVIAILGPSIMRLRTLWEQAEKRRSRKFGIRPGLGGCALWSPTDGTVRAGLCGFFGIVF